MLNVIICFPTSPFGMGVPSSNFGGLARNHPGPHVLLRCEFSEEAFESQLETGF